MNYSKSPIAALVAALCACTTFAQTADTSPQILRKITVTGSTIDDRFGESAREPSSTYSISGKKIEEQHVENFADVLRAIPGVTVDVSGGDELKIKFRGIENQRYMGEKPGVAIVIDGVPVFERTGKVNINLDNIESIKVIKGGASYLFGEDALAGAVVITTKRGATNKGFTVERDMGSYGYQRKLVRVGGANDNFSGHLQVSERQADGYHFQSNYKAQSTTGNLRWLVTPTSDLTLGLDQETRFRDKHGVVTGEKQGIEDPTGMMGRDYARHFDVALLRANLTYSNDITDKTNLLALVYQYTDNTQFWSTPQRFSSTGAAVTATDAYTTLNDYRQTQKGFKTELRTAEGPYGFMGGAEVKRNQYLNLTTAKVSYRSSPFGATTLAGTVAGDDSTMENVDALYGETKWSPVSDWTFTGNARHDRITLNYFAKPVAGNGNKTIDQQKVVNANSLRLGTAWTGIKDTTLFGNVSTGFRAPTVDQLYRGSQNPTGNVANNPDLRPEQAITVELGMKKAFAMMDRPAQFEATLFQVDRKDYILDTAGQYGNANAANVASFQNIGGMRSKGLELALKAEASSTVNWDLAYTYLDSTFTQYDQFLQSLGNPRGMLVGATPACTVGNPAFSWNSCYQLVPYNLTGNKVPRVPQHAVNFRTGWKFAEGWKVTGEMDYRAMSYVDEVNQVAWPQRTVFNLTLDYGTKVSWLWGGTLSAFVRVDNVFAQRYYTIARGTNDSQSYATANKYDGVYNAEDTSLTVDPGRIWRAGLVIRF
jgi:iron complex outermembrane receptor protein